jgi:hypothetical protein
MVTFLSKASLTSRHVRRSETYPAAAAADQDYDQQSLDRFMGNVTCTRWANRRPRAARLLGLAGLLAAMTWSLASHADDADDAKYLVPELLPKVALLIGTQDYSHLDPLPNIGTDVDSLYNAFDRLGFTDILVVTNPCHRDIDNAIETLEQRVRSVAPDGGATVVVFFAGHGYMQGHDQYVIPKDFDASLLGTYEDFQIATPVSLIEDKLESLMVGAGVIIVDACRSTFPAHGSNSADVQELPDCASGTVAWVKKSNAQVTRIGAEAPQQIPYVALAYSTRPGREAAAFLEADKPSTYVAALTAELEGDEPVVPDLFARAYNAIRYSPAKDFYPLQPVFQPNGLVRAYFRDDPANLQTQTTRWHQALSLGSESRSVVENYVKAYPTGEFLRAALLWLKEHPTRQRAAPVIPGKFQAMEVPQFARNLPRGLVLRKFPADVAVSARVKQAREVLLLGIDRRGEWMEVVDETAQEHRFVSVGDLGLRAPDLPIFWSQDDASDVTGCTQRGAEAINCLASFRDHITPGASEVVNVLSVENPDADADEDTPSAVAFGRALEIQLALGDLGVPLAQTIMNVVPRSFAPALSGRVLVKVSPKED